MKTSLPILLAFPLSLARASVLLPRDEFDASSYDKANVITRDVVVIGGGSSGTHSAISLLRNGKTVVVVEQQPRLGGPVGTYTDPASKTTINYGLQAFYNNSVATDYFNYLGVGTKQLTGGPPPPTYADFSSGKKLAITVSNDFAPYSAQLDKYPYLEYGWNLPKPIPEDLLLSFSDFVKKYKLQDLAYRIFSGGRGFANILQQLTVNVFKIVDGSYIQSNTAGKAFQPASGVNSELYDKAAAKLGSNVLFSSTVTSAQRPAKGRGGVSLVVQTPSGRKLIKASKLLITVPTLVDNLKPFALDPTEKEIFSQWSYSSYYFMLIGNTGLPSGSVFQNAVDSPDTFNIPGLPAPYFVSATAIDGLYFSWYCSPTPLSQSQVESDVTAVIKKLRETTGSSTTTDPNYLAFRDALPFKMIVSADALKAGFYDKLDSLQGYRNTWYTGAAFISHDSSVLWNYTQAVILPKVLA